MNQNSNTPTPPPAPLAPQNVQPENKRVAEKPDGKIAWGITILSSMSLLLTLLGYGVSLAVETIFGLPHETVYSSVLDLIGLSVYAMISIALRLGEIPWQAMFQQLWLPSLISALGMFVFICLLYFLKIHRANLQTRGFWRYVGGPTEQDSTAQVLVKGAIGSGFFGGMLMISPILIVGALMLTVALISIIPMFGMQLGAQYFRQFVIAPTACAPVKPRAARLQASSAPPTTDANAAADPIATCVTLFKDETQVARGRVVVSTPTAIILFEPHSGAIRRVPLGELTVLPTDNIGMASERQLGLDGGQGATKPTPGAVRPK